VYEVICIIRPLLRAENGPIPCLVALDKYTYYLLLRGVLSIFYLLPCAHPTCPNRLELSPGRMGWSWNRQNHPKRPLWPREIISHRLRDRAPVGALPPSPEQRDKAAPLGKGVKPPRRAGYCRELDADETMNLRRWICGDAVLAVGSR
jgi:hypothetical protein